METTTAHRAAAALLALGLLTSCGDTGTGTDAVSGSDPSPAATSAGGSPGYGVGGDDATSDDASADETSGDDATSDETTAEDGDHAAGTVTMTITGYAFEVPESVAPGAEITVTNEDGVGHTVTSDDDGATFDVAVGPGETVTFTAPEEAGDYAFHCRPHPAMTATLTVEG